MKSYQVLAAMGFMYEGKAATAWPGSVVMLDDEQAKPFLEGGVVVRVGVDGDTGTQLDGEVVVQPTEAKPDASASRPKGKAE